MGYRNGETGFPKGLLASRGVIKKGDYALLPPNGLVNNCIPGFNNCESSILASPKLGASFVDYIVTVLPNGSIEGFGGNGVETFAFVIDGSLKARAADKSYTLDKGGYLFCPPTLSMHLENTGTGNVQLFMYKRRYDKLEGHDVPPVVCGNLADLEAHPYEGMENLKLYNFLPAADNLSFDMNFHILSFEPGASHGYIETHVQEHGAYILSGEGMYNLGNTWIPVEKDDYIFMGAYTQQVAYAVGKESPFSYIYSKDCNRDIPV